MILDDSPMRRPESDFSLPDRYCRNPQRWHTEDEQGTEIEVSEMIYGLVRGLQPEFCLETGSYHGQTTEAIARALRVNGHGSLLSHETNEGLAERVRSGLDRVGLSEWARVECRRGDCRVHDERRYLDFAFFDSSLEDREGEFRVWYPVMHRSTIVCFHDVAPRHEVVRSAVLRLEAEGKLRAIFLPTPRGLAICQVIPDK